MHPDDDMHWPELTHRRPNVLQLHRATMSHNWPVEMPPPAVFGNHQFGSRIFVRDMHQHLWDEMKQAAEEPMASLVPNSTLLTGNDGSGTVRKERCHIHVFQTYGGPGPEFGVTAADCFF